MFVWLAMADVDAYIAMTEDEVEEEYRRAGKLHRYNPDNEWKKRLARLARKWPPPDGFIPEIDEYLKLLDDDDDDDRDEEEGKELIGQPDMEKNYTSYMRE